MDRIALKDADSNVDLESGEGMTREEDTIKDFVASSKQPNTLLAKVCSAFVDQSETIRYGASSCNDALNLSCVPVKNVRLLMDKENLKGQESRVLVDKKTAREKCKKKSVKKAAKPPRPPRGPSLDAADLKLIRDINELALLKRTRIERTKALKNMKASKSLSSSSNSNLFAMVFTILFFLIIFFQGISSRSSAVRFHGSPESAAGTRGSFISVRYYRDSSRKDISGADSASPDHNLHLSRKLAKI